MKKIRIVSTPAGQAPEWVRKEWVGLELPLGKNPEDVVLLRGVLGGEAAEQNKGGYPVRTEDALRVLSEKHDGAANWWRRAFARNMPQYLVFGRHFCEYIDTDQLSVTE